MKTKLTLLFSLVLFLSINAQIPYATQQPKWYFPIYAKDAFGTMDTVYIGDDPTAQSGNSNDPFYDDINFGEKWIIPSDPNIFRLSTYSWVNPKDSAMKVDIGNYNIINYLYYSITLDSVRFPVTLYWDLQRLRSDSLPFMDQGGGVPKAQLEIDYGGVITTSVGCNWHVTVSDSLKSNCGCCTKDSLVLEDWFTNPGRLSQGISITIVPWTGQEPVSIREYTMSNFTIFPNPFIDEIRIISTSDINSSINQVIITNSIGVELIRSTVVNFVSTKNLNSGLYYIKLLNDKGELIEVKKIIKP